MSKSSKTTSSKVATVASKVLSNPKSTADAKKAAGSALAQKEKGKGK